MRSLIYVRASTKDQDADRVLENLIEFSKNFSENFHVYSENISGTKLDRPQLNKLLDDAKKGDYLLVESVDRLSRLSQDNFELLKAKIRGKGLKLIVMDLPTTHMISRGDESITDAVMVVINNLLIDLFATMARLDNEKRKERIKQGIARSGYKPSGKKPNTVKHKEIKRHLTSGHLTVEEIAALVKVSNTTVYRLQKAMAADDSNKTDTSTKTA